MHIENFKMIGSWRDVADIARVTIGLDKGSGELSYKWKKQILLAEHSPIRKMHFQWKWIGIKSWVSTHFVRHKIGIEHFVQSQRTDRTGINRDKLYQSEIVNHECIANVQAIINISRKRLCRKSANETLEAWNCVVSNILAIKSPIYKICVPECVYRGFCPEFKSCGKIKDYIKFGDIKEYRSV